MFSVGYEIGQTLRATLPSDVRVFNNYPDNLRQFAPCVCVIFGGYNVIDANCGAVMLDTTWRTDIIVKTSEAMYDKSSTERLAETLFNQVFGALNGKILIDGAKPLVLASTGMQAEVTPAIGFYPLSWRAPILISNT